ncbi:purine permease 3-like [Nymphaea colorata]|nr:purine permease 3-like [Nymphaea colorata]
MAEQKVSEISPGHTVVQLETNTATATPHRKEQETKQMKETKGKWKMGSIASRTGLVYWALVFANYLALSIGLVSSNMLSRFYFMHGGSRRWVTSLTQSAGFPFLFIPLGISYYMNPTSSYKPFSCFTPRILLCTIVLGLLIGFDNFIYSWGVSFLSASISSLLLSTQLAFTALFSCLIVKQPMNFPTLNCIILLTLSSALVGFTSSSQRPPGVTNIQYAMGVILTIAAAALYGLYLPLLELLNSNLTKKKKLVITFRLVLETQIVIFATATLFSGLGLVISGDYRRIKTEAAGFNVGEVKYVLCLVFGALAWQMAFVGTAGLVFLTSSLMSGICITALIPAGVLSPLVFFHEGFSAGKGFAIVLSLWAFASYLFGEYKQKKAEPGNEVELGSQKK